MKGAQSALVFGGQGDEQRALANVPIRGSTILRGLLQRAGRRLGMDLEKALAAGTPELLRTEIAQPVVICASIAEARELEQRGFEPDVVVGHSLGELAAFASAGCLESEEAVELACSRGAAMARAARARPGAMVSLAVEAESELDALLALGRNLGTLDVAAHNAAEKWVLSGDARAVAALQSIHPSTRLAVDGAWHSGLMESARVEWLASLTHANWRAPKKRLISNRSGAVVEAGDDLADLLAGQLTRPVRWFATMQTLEMLGVYEIVVAGPHRALVALCRDHFASACTIRHARASMRQAVEVTS